MYSRSPSLPSGKWGIQVSRSGRSSLKVPIGRRIIVIDTPQVTKTHDRLIAVIHVTVPRSAIRTVMQPGLRELTAAVAAQDIALTGPWFTHHLRMDPEVFDFEIGVPVSAPVAAVGRVKPCRRPAMKVARTIYRGPYEGLGAAWSEFDSWIETHGHTAATDLWECYAAGPKSSADPANWCTELDRPLLDESRRFTGNESDLGRLISVLFNKGGSKSSLRRKVLR
jgi:effector-binding domain-containing protein